MVAQQGEMVTRIDDDVHDVADNVSGAQRELLKYYESISSNRMLMLKIFGVMIIFVSLTAVSLFPSAHPICLVLALRPGLIKAQFSLC